jgi:hypothetical protein
VIVAGAMPVMFGRTREAVFELARRAGYPIVAEAGSQLRFGSRPDDVVLVDHFDLIASSPHPSLILQLGAEPVAASWPAFVTREPRAARWVLGWLRNDPTHRRRILGEVPHAIDAIGMPSPLSSRPGAEPETDARARAATSNAPRRRSPGSATGASPMGPQHTRSPELDIYADSEVPLRAAIGAPRR